MSSIGTVVREQEAEKGAGRFTVDDPKTMGYPLVPYGRTPGNRVVSEQGRKTVHYDELGWKWEVDLDEKEEFAQHVTTMLYDVYYGLLFLFREAGFPEDNTVYFSQVEFLRMIDWVVPGAGSSRDGRPNGRHYRLLKEILLSLMKTQYELDTDVSFKAYNMVDHFELEKSKPGPRSTEGDGRSYVVFGREFSKRIRSADPRIRIPYDILLSLSSGSPRALFRTLTWLREQGLDTMPLQTFMERLGSVQTRYLPSVARKILRSGVNELIQREVLASEESYERLNDVWYITFNFADPQKPSQEDDLILGEALTWGVHPKTAKSLLISSRERMMEVLAAVAVGEIEKRASIASTIVYFTNHQSYNLPLKSEGRAKAGKGATDAAADLYGIWSRNEQDEYLRSLGTCIDERMKMVRENRDNRSLPVMDDWFYEGVARMDLRREMEQPSLDQWRKNMGMS